jgi:hypothetical protein
MNPLPFSLVPHLFDSAISTAGLFVFLLIPSQPDHDFFPLQKLFSCTMPSLMGGTEAEPGFPDLTLRFNLQQIDGLGRAASFNSD